MSRLPDAALAGLLAVGVALRVVPGLFSSFPLGDGGLFAVMASELQAAGWRLPELTSYNGGEIPFTYPPLGLYVLAGLAALLGQSPVQVMDWWPPMLAVLSMVAAWLLLAQLTDRRTAAWVVALFALTPRSFEWLIVGGGVTRTLGFTLALLALWQLVVALRSRRLVPALAAGALAGLTLLTHPEASSFGVVSMLALSVWVHRQPGGLCRFIRAAVPAAAVAGLLVAPWLAVTVARHGWLPYLHAITSHNEGGVVLQHVLGVDTGFLLPVDPVKIAGAIGLAVMLRHRSWFVPVWYLGLMALITGAGPTYAMLPLSLAGVMGVRWLLARIGRPRGLRLVAAGATAAVVLAALAPLQPLSPARQVSDEAREMMAWIRDHTGPDSRFALVSGFPWWADTEAEWFPALTGRVSVATTQGSEWLEAERWNELLDSHERLQACAHASRLCLASWADRYAPDADYVWRHGWARVPLSDPILRTDEHLLVAWRAQPLLAARPCDREDLAYSSCERQLREAIP